METGRLKPFVILWIGLILSVSCAVGGTFREVADPMIVARFFHTATLMGDGRVFLAGGLLSDLPIPVSSTEIYDPPTGLFERSINMKGPRFYHTATFLEDGRILIIGVDAFLGASAGEIVDTDAVLTVAYQLEPGMNPEIVKPLAEIKPGHHGQ